MAAAAQVVTLETPSLGDRSYLVHDGEVALVVDPQRDIDRVLDAVRDAGVQVTHVLETHVHNDYLTGGHALAAETGAQYLVNAEDEVAFERTGVSAGDVVEVGSMSVTALATPGHTFTHLSYLVRQGEDPVGVFTGGSLLYGATGRPDLLGDEHTEELARLQHRSARHLVENAPEESPVFPTHGFGSFCSSGSTGGATESTLAEERRNNPVLTQDEEDWVEEMVAGLDEWPAYYVHMMPANETGPSAPDLSPPQEASSAELRRRIEDGEWVVDLRSRTAFAAGHSPGTFNFGVDGQFVTYLGWLIEWGTPVTLLAETAEEVAEAQREMVRIGIDRPHGAAVGGPEQWTPGSEQSYETATFADLDQVRHHRPVTVLDVRRSSECADSHIAGAVNVPIHDLPRRLDELEDLGVGADDEVWVHCASGYRASIGASFVASTGRRVVLVDDEYDAAHETGLDVVHPGDDETDAGTPA